MSCIRKCLTTGVLNRNLATNFALTIIANFTNTEQRVTVTVYNWDADPVVPIPGCIFNEIVPANDDVVLSCPLPAGVIHYEVRVNIPAGPLVDLVVNVFGVTGGASDPALRANQEGNTVLFRDLVPISYRNCDFFICDDQEE